MALIVIGAMKYTIDFFSHLYRFKNAFCLLATMPYITYPAKSGLFSNWVDQNSQYLCKNGLL